MCGIFAYKGHSRSSELLHTDFMSIQHRGPDDSAFKKVGPDLYFGFHRLAINGLHAAGNQPMELLDCVLIANAEIFNYKEIAGKYHFKLQTGSDCEVLIHLYRKLGMPAMLQELDAEYAFILFDKKSGDLFAARDHLGIRGMYIGEKENGDMAWASEAKALVHMDRVTQFPPGHWYSYKKQDYSAHFKHEYARHDISKEEDILEQIRFLLTASVKRRSMSERPVGALLSGGLDSSLIAALAAKHREGETPLETFSIGLKGSPDLYHAKLVADHIGSKHHSFELTETEFLSYLDETIYITGSYDVTTIRASVGHALVSKKVKENSDVKVLFTGETIDEMGSYLYFQNAPSSDAFQEEAIRLLKDIHFFDMLRGDRSISHAGLEARVPFADKSFLEFYMGLDPSLRQFNQGKMEKYLLRKAFASDKLLPEKVLWRRKNGFSDSVSQKNRSWSDILKEHIDILVSDEEFLHNRKDFGVQAPVSKEAYYYRKVFTQHYGIHQNLTPYQWLPKWCGDMTDPSARKLALYQAD